MKKKRAIRRTTPTPTTVMQKCPLDDVALWQCDKIQPTPPEICYRYTRNSRKWRPRANLKLPARLCYLATVEEHNWPAAVTTLGYYLSVNALQNCGYMVKDYCAMLKEQAPGIYHMVTTFTVGVTTLFLANPLWVIGAHLPH